MQPQVAAALGEAVSKIHISFDGWTTKGGKRGFFGIVANYATADSTIKNVAIDLPQVMGAHTGDRIADCIEKTLQRFGISASKLGYFMLDNAANNDTAIAALGSKYGFVASQRRLRCGAHTINLVGQAVIFGTNDDAFDNDEANVAKEEQLLNNWRRQGPLSTLIDVIHYIRTPQQYKIFRNFQCIANRELPSGSKKLLQLVEPIITRWNSYCSTFERAVKLQSTFNKYINYHVNTQQDADAQAASRNNQTPKAPAWMRSGGLTAHDWAVITEYIEILQPLKAATKRFEGRGKCGRFGAIYEVLPIFEYLLREF